MKTNNTSAMEDRLKNCLTFRDLNQDQKMDLISKLAPLVYHYRSLELRLQYGEQLQEFELRDMFRISERINQLK